jgi:hypothetical protein
MRGPRYSDCAPGVLRNLYLLQWRIAIASSQLAMSAALVVSGDRIDPPSPVPAMQAQGCGGLGGADRHAAGFSTCD